MNTNTTIDGCLFEGNRALMKDAGAVILDCQDTSTSKCSYTVRNSVFRNNTAKMNGGAIKYTYYAPEISVNNTFVNNTAMYGPTIASYAV